MPKRVISWIWIVWTVIFVIWIWAAAADRPSKECAPGDQACQDASDVGTGIGVGQVVSLFIVGFVILFLVWVVTHPSRRRNLMLDRMFERYRWGHIDGPTVPTIEELTEAFRDPHGRQHRFPHPDQPSKAEMTACPQCRALSRCARTHAVRAETSRARSNERWRAMYNRRGCNMCISRGHKTALALCRCGDHKSWPVPRSRGSERPGQHGTIRAQSPDDVAPAQRNGTGEDRSASGNRRQRSPCVLGRSIARPCAASAPTGPCTRRTSGGPRDARPTVGRPAESKSTLRTSDPGFASACLGSRDGASAAHLASGTVRCHAAKRRSLPGWRR